MQTQKQVRTDIAWQQRLESSFLLKFPQNASQKITVSRNLAGISFPAVHRITEHTDFSSRLFVKTLMWRHIVHKIPWFYSFGWRLMQWQHETLSSKSVVSVVSFICIYKNFINTFFLLHIQQICILVS